MLVEAFIKLTPGTIIIQERFYSSGFLSVTHASLGEWQRSGEARH